MVGGEQGAELKRALRQMPCGVVLASRSEAGEIIFVNDEFVRMTGYAHADVPTVKDWLLRAYPDPDYRAYVTSNWERDVSEPGRDVFYRVRRADGSDRNLLLRAGLLGDDQMVVTLLDFTERWRTEEKLRESQEQFRLISDNIDQVLWIYSIQSDSPNFVSPAFETIWGVSAQTVIGDPYMWQAAIVEEDRERVAALWDEVLSGNRDDLELVFRIRRPDGEIRWIEDRGFGVRSSGGSVPRMVGIAKDITERVQAEEAARELQRRRLQEQKIESLGVLAGGVAHDLNNLLMGVLGHADLLLSDLSATSPLRQRIEAIETSARRGAELARQLLAYSGRGKFVTTRIDLRLVVEEMAALMRAVISKKIELDLDLQGEPIIEGDPSQIRQVIMNLLTNASEAIDDRPGNITIRTGVVVGRDGEEERATGVEPKSGSHVRLLVEDDGPGMTADVRSRIFDPFFTTKPHGRGLGLASVLGIVKGHSGSVELDTLPGGGSRFSVTFPALPVDSVSGTKPATRQSAPQDRATQTVLLVDDEEIVREAVSSMLERGGHRVLTARDGEDAVDVFRRHQREIDVVILDLTMPKLNGRETLRLLRGIDPDVPVLLSSGFSREAEGDLLAAEVPTGFLQKPYTSEKLNHVLAELRRSVT